MEHTTIPDDVVHQDMTINEIIRRWPATVAVFGLLGLDACCGGGLPLREAAARHARVAEDVVAVLRTALESCP